MGGQGVGGRLEVEWNGNKREVLMGDIRGIGINQVSEKPPGTHKDVSN